MRVPQAVRNHKLVTILTIVIVAPIVVVMTLWTAISLSFTYLEPAGERAGFLQKISKRGWLCKTWEW